MKLQDVNIQRLDTYVIRARGWQPGGAPQRYWCVYRIYLFAFIIFRYFHDNRLDIDGVSFFQFVIIAYISGGSEVFGG